MSSSVGRCRRVEAAEQVDDLGDGQLRVERGRLEADADPRLERVGLAGDVEAEDGHLAAIGLAQALEDLDRRGLAGAVRAEQAEDLAAGDLEVDARDRLDVAVALGQAPDSDDRIAPDRAVMVRWCHRRPSPWRCGRPGARVVSARRAILQGRLPPGRPVDVEGDATGLRHGVRSGAGAPRPM